MKTLTLVALVVALAALIAAWMLLQRRRRLRQLERLGFASPSVLPAASGPAAIRGRVVGDAPLRAPFSGKECVAFRICVHEDEKESGAAPYLLDSTTTTSFELVSGDETATVESSEGMLLMMEHREAVLIIDGKNASYYRTALASLELELELDTKAFRVHELLLMPDDEVVIRGTVERDPEETRIVNLANQPLLLLRGDLKKVAAEMYFHRLGDLEALERIK